MSLELIFNHSNLKELKPKLKELFPIPTFVSSHEIRTPARTKNYSTVGQAFDYLLRFYLEIKNPGKLFKRDLVADKGYSKLLTRLIHSDSEFVRAGRTLETHYNRIELIGFITQEFYRARRNLQASLEKKKVTEELIKSSLFLARLDVTVRAGIIDPNFLIKNDDDLADLKDLLKNLNWRFFKVKTHCVLNPTFGKGSTFILGADGDLIIDDTLIDIKVTQEFKFKREYLNQLIIYHTLYRMGGIDIIPYKIKINNIGIYFARHSKLVKIPLLELATNKTYKEFDIWFKNYVNKNMFGKNK